jgi:hypothetical protein
MSILSLYHASQIHHTLLPMLLQIAIDSMYGWSHISIYPSVLDANHTFGSIDLCISLVCATCRTCELSMGTRLWWLFPLYCIDLQEYSAKSVSHSSSQIAIYSSSQSFCLPVNIVIESFSSIQFLNCWSTHSNVSMRSSLIKACANTTFYSWLLNPTNIASGML